VGCQRPALTQTTPVLRPCSQINLLFYRFDDLPHLTTAHATCTGANTGWVKSCSSQRSVIETTKLHRSIASTTSIRHLQIGLHHHSSTFLCQQLFSRNPDDSHNTLNTKLITEDGSWLCKSTDKSGIGLANFPVINLAPFVIDKCSSDPSMDRSRSDPVHHFVFHLGGDLPDLPDQMG